MDGRNPLLPLHIAIADGEAHVASDGRVYVYGSLDLDTEDWCSPYYRVASSADMREWRVTENYSFDAALVPWAGKAPGTSNETLELISSFEDLPTFMQWGLKKEAADRPFEEIRQSLIDRFAGSFPAVPRLYAPDSIEKDGRTYLYFCLSDDSEGVAVSESPEGPFTEPVQLKAKGIDPAIFIDDDGQAYYYWGQFSAKGARLLPNMCAIDESSIVEGIVTEEEHHFHEGSSMRRRGDTYYYVFADISRGKPSCLGYATSKAPLGPFTYQGVIIDNIDCDPMCWNNHGSIQEVNGQWYVFYHRSSNHDSHLRRLCCEKIEFDENGLIPEVKMTSQGAGDPLQIGEDVPAYLACGYKGGAYLDTVSYAAGGDVCDVADAASDVRGAADDAAFVANGGAAANSLPGAVVMPAGSEAIFRYLEVKEPGEGGDKTSVSVKISGAFADVSEDPAATVSLICDGAVVGQGRLGEVFSAEITVGLHEIRIRANADLTLERWVIS